MKIPAWAAAVAIVAVVLLAISAGERITEYRAAQAGVWDWWLVALQADDYAAARVDERPVNLCVQAYSRREAVTLARAYWAAYGNTTAADIDVAVRRAPLRTMPSDLPNYTFLKVFNRSPLQLLVHWGSAEDSTLLTIDPTSQSGTETPVPGP